MLRIIRNLGTLFGVILAFIFIPYFTGRLSDYLLLTDHTESVVLVWSIGFILDIVVVFVLSILTALYNAIDTIFYR